MEFESEDVSKEEMKADLDHFKFGQVPRYGLWAYYTPDIVTLEGKFFVQIVDRVLLRRAPATTG